MDKFYKILISEITDTLDPLYNSINDLKKADRDDIVDCTVLCTRAKIYTNGMEMVKMLKKKNYNGLESITSRIIKLISIHRNQLYKLSKRKTIDLSNFMFLAELKKLIIKIKTTFTPESLH